MSPQSYFGFMLSFGGLEGLMPGPTKQLSAGWVTNQSTAIKKDLQGGNFTASHSFSFCPSFSTWFNAPSPPLHMPALRSMGYIASFWHQDILVTLLANLNK